MLLRLALNSCTKGIFLPWSRKFLRPDHFRTHGVSYRARCDVRSKTSQAPALCYSEFLFFHRLEDEDYYFHAVKVKHGGATGLLSIREFEVGFKPRQAALNDSIPVQCALETLERESRNKKGL